MYTLGACCNNWCDNRSSHRTCNPLLTRQSLKTFTYLLKATHYVWLGGVVVRALDSGLAINRSRVQLPAGPPHCRQRHWASRSHTHTPHTHTHTYTRTHVHSVFEVTAVLRYRNLIILILKSYCVYSVYVLQI